MRITTACLGCTLALAARAAPADAIFDNFGPGDSYNAGGFWNAGVVDPGPPPAVATPSMGFTVPAGAGYRLDEVDLALGLYQGDGGALVQLRCDDDGRPGRPVARWAVGSLPDVAADDDPVRLIAVDHPNLIGGAAYWLTAGRLGTSDAWLGWDEVAIPGDYGPVYDVIDGHAYSRVADRGAFRIAGTPGLGTPTPEPGTLAGAILGAIALLLALSRRARTGGLPCATEP